MNAEPQKNRLKSRVERHAFYPPRFPVSEEKANWDIAFPEYDPPYVVAPGVLQKGALEDFSKVRGKFQSFEGEVKRDSLGRPLNPMGRTGIAGRGVLWQWGANLAVDAVLTRPNLAHDGVLVLLIRRKDTGKWAFPGGMLDFGEHDLVATERELREETGIIRSMGDAVVVYRGYADGPRNTDHAWIETIVRHVHLLRDNPRWKFIPGDDAAAVAWKLVTPELIASLYGSHGEILKIVLARLLYDTVSFL